MNTIRGPSPIPRAPSARAADAGPDSTPRSAAPGEWPRATARAPVRLPRSLLWELKGLHRLAERLEERADDLYWRVHLALTTAGAASTAVDDGGRPRGRRTRHAASLSAPASWLTKFTTQQRPDGSVIVSVNGKAPFVLPAHLGALFLVLAEDTGLSTDEGVGFKTLRDLSIRVGKRTGGTQPSPDTLNKYVCKLRKTLMCRAGLHADVIQTHRRLGRRLAVKRTAVARERGD